MKLILTGTTGFIGTEVVAQCLNHPSITSIIVLSRKPLDSTLTSNPKLKVVILEDFDSYPPSVLSELAGADACIWAIGAKSISEEMTRKVSIGYTLAAAQAFASLPTSSPNHKFRFVFTSGILAIRDPKEFVLLYPAPRKAAGEAESKLIEFAAGKEGFEVFIMRPASVLRKEGGVVDCLMGLAPSVRVDELAASLIDATVVGGGKQTVENKELQVKGRELLVLKSEARMGLAF